MVSIRSVVLSILLVSAIPSQAVAADGYTDKEVYDLADQINDRFNRWKWFCNCKQFALFKLQHLEYAGIPARYVVVLTEKNQVHMVVEADGKWILDNRYRRVQTWKDVIHDGYHFIPGTNKGVQDSDALWPLVGDHLCEPH